MLRKVLIYREILRNIEKLLVVLKILSLRLKNIGFSVKKPSIQFGLQKCRKSLKILRFLSKIFIILVKISNRDGTIVKKSTHCFKSRTIKIFIKIVGKFY